MRYITNTLDFQLDKRSVVTLGKFDGLHRGHDKLITRALELGKNGYDTVVFTFDVSPLVKLVTRITRTLLTNEERRVLLERKKIDCLIECPFVPEVIHMEPQDFVREVLAVQLRAAYVIVGPDFHFGHNRKGTPQLLQKLGVQYGFQVEILDKEEEDSREISSTWIRETLREGRIEKVNHLLGYPYFVKGKVVHGRQLGRTWGLPTINQIPDPVKMTPPWGVYYSRTHVAGRWYPGISNIGMKPTVGGTAVGLETYLFDCSLDLYGQTARVELLSFRRPEEKFADIDELKEQMDRDIQAADLYFSKEE